MLAGLQPSVLQLLEQGLDLLGHVISGVSRKQRVVCNLARDDGENALSQRWQECHSGQSGTIKEPKPRCSTATRA